MLFRSEALEALSDLYGRQNDLPSAVAVTEQVIDSEPDGHRRLPFLLRLAVLTEKLGDLRRAGTLLKRAVDEFTPEEIGSWTTTSHTPMGKLWHLAPVTRMSETPPHWDKPTVPLGYHKPVWPA